jgi:hypothetical protein
MNINVLYEMVQQRCTRELNGTEIRLSNASFMRWTARAESHRVACDGRHENRRSPPITRGIKRFIKFLLHFFCFSPILLHIGKEIEMEIEGYSWIEIQFYVSGTVEEVFEQYQRLNQERMRHLPFDKSEMIGISIGWV